jgi:hypothetical protein
MKPYYLILVISILSCNNHTLENKLVDTSKKKYWKIIKWNDTNYADDTLLLKFYSNYEYDFFRYNRKKDRVISLRPGSASDIVAFQHWTIQGDTALSLIKKGEFNFLFSRNDTLWFYHSLDSLVITPFTGIIY